MACIDDKEVQYSEVAVVFANMTWRVDVGKESFVHRRLLTAITSSLLPYVITSSKRETVIHCANAISYSVYMSPSLCYKSQGILRLSQCFLAIRTQDFINECHHSPQSTIQIIPRASLFHSSGATFSLSCSSGNARSTGALLVRVPNPIIEAICFRFGFALFSWGAP